MRSINQVLDAISGKRVLALVMLQRDHYLHGDVQRMSPEASVPVLTHQSEDFRLGGAANVALNLEGLGIRTVLILPSVKTVTERVFKTSYESNLVTVAFSHFMIESQPPRRASWIRISNCCELTRKSLSRFPMR